MSRVVSLALNAADHLMSKGRLDAAASILQNYLSTNQPDGSVLQRLGRIYLAQGRSEEAIHLLQQALTCFQNQSPAGALRADGVAGANFSSIAPPAEVDSGFIAAH